VQFVSPELLRDAQNTHSPTTETGAADAGPSTSVARPASSSIERDQQREMIDLVTTLAADVLGHASAEEIEADRPFRDLGFDSLNDFELIDRLAAAVGMKLPSSLLSDHPTPAAVADFLYTQLLTTDAPHTP
jgi:acyl carrier protein